MRTITVEQRRRAMVHRHHLAGDATDPEAVTRALIALHATDPASVYLSVLARSAVSTLADVADALYERRSLVRWMAMRRTLFVFPREDIPTVQAAVSTPLAAMLRRRLIRQLQRSIPLLITAAAQASQHLAPTSSSAPPGSRKLAQDPRGSG